MFKNACLLILVAITFSSCQKLLDYYNYNNAKPPAGCKIIKTSNDQQSYTTSNVFLYHSNGLPAAIKHQTYDKEFDFIDSFTRVFTYDHLDRLIADTSDNWYTGAFVYYAYEGNSRLPVRDTVRALYETYVNDLEYDAQGRIIKVTQRILSFVIPEDHPGPYKDVVSKYYYDLRGNRQEHPSNVRYSGLIEYSDKPSLYSLHPVWQLIHKNYSRNSVPFGETFNEHGLPLSIKDAPVSHFQQFLKTVGQGSKLEYDCAE
jgi:hypothetical protein